MTAVEKTTIARFLDTGSAVLRGGWAEASKEYEFLDDAAPPEMPAAPVFAVEDASVNAKAKAALDGVAHDLAAVAVEIAACTACALHKGRRNVVPGEGAVGASGTGGAGGGPLVLVGGEGPGAEEDAAGRPVVGPAGQLLNRMLGAIGLSRGENCFIANIVKCRPPGNRTPLPEESAACLPFLARQIDILKPKAILSMGAASTKCLLQTDEGISRLRGRIFPYNGIPLMPTFHPSYLLRDETKKRDAWVDLQQLCALLAGLDAGYAKLAVVKNIMERR
jgi:DNA polymerase